MDRLNDLRHPARLLDRFGFKWLAERLRRLRWGAYSHLSAFRPDTAAHLTSLWVREPLGRRSYRVLSERELLDTRRSDTVFVFGSGRSLVDLGADDWQRIAASDTVGFSHFHRQRWVRADYYLVAELASAREAAASIAANPLFSETIFGLMSGWMAEMSNDILANTMLPRSARIFRWRRVARGRSVEPSRHLADGLAHGVGTILDAVNFAIVMGWRRIVIAGVDLYNREYFWLPPDTTHENELPGIAASATWEHADTIVDNLGDWRDLLETEGISLEVYDPRSLLARRLPVSLW